MPKYKRIPIAPKEPIYVLREVQRVDEHGVTRVTHVPVDVTDPSNAQEMPTLEEMSLQNQLATGIGLGNSVGNILNPIDPLGGAPLPAEVDYEFEQMLSAASENEQQIENEPIKE